MTLAISKKPGANASDVAQAAISRIESSMLAGNAANAAMLRPERTPRQDLMTRDSAGIPDLGYRLLTDAGRILGALVTMVGVRRLSSRCAGEGLAGGSWGDLQIGISQLPVCYHISLI